ncbi:MAG: single-stranded-DNA-specific exonuclease RecJ [Patescibacteria group bacterium]
MRPLHPLVERLIVERGIGDIESFCAPSYDERPDPFLMRDMDVAVERVLLAFSRGETVAVWSDYDCDGVPGGALMRDFFKLINYPLTSYIAERSEGYGLNKAGIAKLHEEGVSLIISVDCGITAVAEVTFAKTLGVDVIITDHHLPQEYGLPNAVAVLNPHRADCEYPFKELCGTGVAFKFAEAILARGSFATTPGALKWLLDLVAIATIADMVSLTGENRTLVHFGLVVLKKGRRKGLRTLLEKMRIPIATITEDDISFSVAPKINAASRMKSPQLALELLTTTDDVRAKELAKELVRLNDARKLEGARVAKEVKHRLEGRPLGNVIVLGHVDWKPSLLGIAATNIVETYQKTVCLWGKEGDLIKGSCRSNGSVNIVALMTHAKEAFIEFGGHELSGGFSVKAEAIHTLSEILEEKYAGATTVDAPTTKKSATDPLKASLGELNTSLYESMRALAPFGMGNPKPLFSILDVRVEQLMYFGSHQEHARVTFSDEMGKKIDAVSFFISRAPFKSTLSLLSKGDRVTITGSFEQSFFGNKKEMRLRLEEISLAAPVTSRTVEYTS